MNDQCLQGARPGPLVTAARKDLPAQRRTLIGAAMVGVLLPAVSPLLAQPQGVEPRLAPDFELPVWDLSRNAIHPSARFALSGQRGRWTYLDFWASWCGPCRQSFPWMNRLSTRLGSGNLDVVAVGLDTQPEPMARFISLTQPRFAVLWDATQFTAPLYALKTIPSSCLIDPKGLLVWRHRGFEASEAVAIERAIQQRMEGA